MDAGILKAGGSHIACPTRTAKNFSDYSMFLVRLNAKKTSIPCHYGRSVKNLGSFCAGTNLAVYMTRYFIIIDISSLK